MLVVKDLKVAYGRVPALQGISLTVNEGEIVGVIGPNGAGKTTLLHAIAGAIPIASGSIQLAAEELSGHAPEDIVRRGVALVPEGRRIFATLTVKENLRLGLTARKDRIRVDTAIANVLKRFPSLERLLGTPAGRLSGGEQQQLAIARALLSAPRLILLDEPSLGLAPIVVDAVFALVEELRADGVTILLVEQNAYRTLEIADRMYVLNTGKIGFQGTGAELLSTSDFATAYLGIPDSRRE